MNDPEHTTVLASPDGATLVATPGQRFASATEYLLIRVLGAGGMGEVWLAERRTMGGHCQPVALKLLRPETRVGALSAEALKVSRLVHDNIVPFVDSGRDAQGRPFVALAYVNGPDLDALRTLASGRPEIDACPDDFGRLPDELVGFVVFMVLRALAYAHHADFGDGGRGLVHRDISPGNVLIDAAQGFVKLADFGVATSLAEAAGAPVAGKVPYLAPEVLLGEPAGTTADLYALGIVAYELLTGLNPNLLSPATTPLVGAIGQALVACEARLRPPHEIVPDVATGLSLFVARLCANRPEERFPSAEAAQHAVRDWLYDRGFGPTTGSLAAWIALARNPGIAASPFMHATLSFLGDETGALRLHPMRRLSPGARDALARGANPCRGPA